MPIDDEESVKRLNHLLDSSDKKSIGIDSIINTIIVIKEMSCFTKR